MIFVTIGMQLHFDRLIQAMDELAPNLDEEVIAQIGTGRYVPRNLAFKNRYSRDKIDQLFSQASLIIGHAGIGTILSAQRHEKPLVIMPRRADLGEHRNDHQMATARQLHDRPGITIAFKTEELASAIAHATNVKPVACRDSPEIDRLKQAIVNFIENGNLS